jgi:hypothetical protein
LHIFVIIEGYFFFYGIEAALAKGILETGYGNNREQ